MTVGAPASPSPFGPWQPAQDRSNTAAPWLALLLASARSASLAPAWLTEHAKRSAPRPAPSQVMIDVSEIPGSADTPCSLIDFSARVDHLDGYCLGMP